MSKAISILKWGEVGSQNRLFDSSNPYNHLNGKAQKKYHKTSDDSGKVHEISYRGVQNLSPQKDIDLGKKSSTHRIISEGLARLVSGKGIEYSLKDKSGEDEIDRAKEILEKGIVGCIKKIANGIVYQSIVSIIATQTKPKEKKGKVKNEPEHFAVKNSETLRLSKPEFSDKAEYVSKYHYYHNDWNYNKYRKKLCCDRPFKMTLPKIVHIKKYIEKQSEYQENKVPSFYVHSSEHEQSELERYISFEIRPNKGVFDGVYPLPIWKTNQSINDIQGEFESSCIRLDYLRNGLHVVAIVNCYSKRFTNLTGDELQKTIHDEFDEKLSIVDTLKNSYNSGNILVQPLYTDDPEKDGKIEIEKVDATFPYESYKGFDESAKNTILSSWGVQPDLFGIKTNEASNLRSQEGFMKMAIIIMNQQVSYHQKTITDGLDNILKYYGITNVSLSIEAYDSSMYLNVMSELAEKHMLTNEVRRQLLNIKELDDDEYEKFMTEKESKSKEQKTKENE